MADTGVKYPQTITTVQESPYDDNDWATPDNVKADDAAYAEIISPTFDSPDYSFSMRATALSMGVPAGATIDGILVEIERYNDAGELGKDAVVQLTKDGATGVGDNKADTVNTWPTSPTIKSYGGAADLWGTTWTEAEINSVFFGLKFAAQATTANADIYVDFIRITVYYSGGLTAVGDTVQEIWHIRQAVPDTLQLVHHVRQAVPDTVQFVHHVRAAIGDTSQYVWNVLVGVPVGDVVELVWHARATIGKTSQTIWNIRSLIGDTLQSIWHVPTPVADTMQAVWHILIPISDSVQTVWHVRETVAKTQQLVWNVLAQVVIAWDSLQLTWNIKSAVFDILQTIWRTWGEPKTPYTFTDVIDSLAFMDTEDKLTFTDEKDSLKFTEVV